MALQRQAHILRRQILNSKQQQKDHQGLCLISTPYQTRRAMGLNDAFACGINFMGFDCLIRLFS